MPHTGPLPAYQLLVTPILNTHHLSLFQSPLSQSWTPQTLTQSLLFQRVIRFEAIPRCRQALRTLRPRPNGAGILGNPFLGTSSLGPQRYSQRCLPTSYTPGCRESLPRKRLKGKTISPQREITQNPPHSPPVCVIKPQRKNKAPASPSCSCRHSSPNPAPRAAALVCVKTAPSRGRRDPGAQRFQEVIMASLSVTHHSSPH